MEVNSKEQRRLEHSSKSRHLANEFCKAYTRKFGLTASVTSVETENVDAIILLGGEAKPVVVALEFVGYHQADDYHELEKADSNMRERISTALAASGLLPFQVCVWWASEPRRKPRPGFSDRRPRIPCRQAETEGFTKEIVSLAVRAQKDGTLCNNRIRFCNDPEARRRGSPPGDMFLAKQDFPFLSKYCYYISLALWPISAARPHATTSADVRVVGVDEKQLTGAIRRKLEEKLPRYRVGIGNKKLWLVVHSDGYPLSTHVPPGLYEDVLRVIRQGMQQAQGSFDKVWWAENIGFLDAAELYKVL